MSRLPTPTQRLVDLLIAVAFVALGVLVGVGAGSFSIGDSVVAVVLGAALALRRTAPGAALGIAWSGAVLQMAVATAPSNLDAAIPAIVYACAAYGSTAVKWTAFSSSLVGAGIAGVFTARYEFAASIRVPDTLPSTVSLFLQVSLLTGVTLLLAWTLGVLVTTARQSRRNRADAVAATQVAATEQERTRIARDMHDVVAHSLAVVIAQSDGARLLRTVDPAAVDEALETIGSTARAALADVRVLLQQLRYEGTTSVQPGLADLDALLEGFRASGLDIDLDRSGALDECGTAVQIAVFRIVQESLTNALRHGDTGRPVRVVLARTAQGVEAEVSNALLAQRTTRESTGHGLIGMTERAQTVDGRLTAEREGDRFVVRAFLPVGAVAGIAS